MAPKCRLRARPADVSFGAPGFRGAASAAWAAAIALASGGCAQQQQTYVGQRSNPIYATESLGTLEAVIPEAMAVRSVLAAAEAALRDRGYTIWSRRTTDERGRIEARPPSRDLGRRWIVEARATENGQTALSVEARPWAEDGACRVLMDSILERLGR